MLKTKQADRQDVKELKAQNDDFSVLAELIDIDEDGIFFKNSLLSGKMTCSCSI
jgi:hypothetical protein